MRKVDLDLIESLEKDPTWEGRNQLRDCLHLNCRDIIAELRVAREVVAQAQLESKSYPPSEPMSRMLDRYDKVTQGVEE